MAKSKKIAIVVAAIALIAVIGVVGSTLAYFTDTSTKNNTFTMGKVTGTLEEKTDEGSDPIKEDGIPFDNVTPNASLTKIAYMQLGSDSSDAYARVKLTWDTSLLNEKQLAEFTKNPPVFEPVGEGWVKGDQDYYYYQPVLKANNKTNNIIEKVIIPYDWSNDMANAKFALKVEGDFIQADNFTPNYGEDGKTITGWGDVKIEQFKAPETQQTQP